MVLPRASLLLLFVFSSACTRSEPSPEPATPASASPVPPASVEPKAAEPDDGSIPDDVAKALAARYPGPPDGMCSPPVVCGDLVKIDCGSAVDGPLHYVKRKTGEEVSLCGGACFHPMGKQIEVCKTMCPPPEWTCE